MYKRVEKDQESLNKYFGANANMSKLVTYINTEFPKITMKSKELNDEMSILKKKAHIIKTMAGIKMKYFKSKQ